MSAEGSAAYQQALAGAGLGDALHPWHAAFADAGREALAPTRALAALQPTLDDDARHRASAIAREPDARRFVDPDAIDARAAERMGERPRAEGVYYTPRIVARALATLLCEQKRYDAAEVSCGATTEGRSPELGLLLLRAAACCCVLLRAAAAACCRGRDHLFDCGVSGRAWCERQSSSERQARTRATTA